MNDFNQINFHDFVDKELSLRGFAIKLISEDYMNHRLPEIMNFVNIIREEHGAVYGWQAESKAYFTNGLNRKWDFSFAIERINTRELCFISFSSVYGDNIHIHCSYANAKYRNMGLAKLHMIKLCQTAIDAGFTHLEGYWPKHNNGSIILHLRMGWQIEDLRKEGNHLFIIGVSLKVRNQVYLMLRTKNTAILQI